MSTNNQEEARKTSLENEKWLMQLELLLRIHTRHPALSVSWMAEKLHISERQFSRKTLLLTGNKPLDVIREARLQAVTLLDAAQRRARSASTPTHATAAAATARTLPLGPSIALTRASGDGGLAWLKLA